MDGMEPAIEILVVRSPGTTKISSGQPKMMLELSGGQPKVFTQKPTVLGHILLFL